MNEIYKEDNNYFIGDTKTPILVLFGPPHCGKSMTMVRLARYLRKNNYRIEPCRTFRPATDRLYDLDCLDFNNKIATNLQLPGNAWDEYILATVYDNSYNRVFHILDGCGEAYFQYHGYNTSDRTYPAYFNKVKSCDAPKIWCFFIEPNLIGGKYQEYVERIKSTQSFIDIKKDKIIILYNKVDLLLQYIRLDRITVKELMGYADQQYEGLFDAFKNKRLIECLWRPYLFKFVPFSTGDYSDGDFVESHDCYPKQLLSAILS